jgi:hypothetical protein
MAMLDEAVAAATAGGRNLIVVGDACCNMLSACDRAADFERAVQWCEVVDRFARRYNATMIFHYCRVIYCGVLISRGRWDEAERELQAALRVVEQKYPTEKVHSLSRLALLCVRRGRLEEASQLLAGLETHGVAAQASASLHIARGQAALAAAVLDRRIGTLGDGLVSAPRHLGHRQAFETTSPICQVRCVASRASDRLRTRAGCPASTVASTSSAPSRMVSSKAVASAASSVGCWRPSAGSARPTTPVSPPGAFLRTCSREVESP